MYAQNKDYAYFYATVNQGYSITINGNSKSGTTATLSSTTNGSATLISHSLWVAYTGNKSITISGAANMSNIYANSTALGNRSVSGTAVLDKVGEKPPVPTVSAPTTSTISEIETSITIAWAKSSDYSGKATYTVQVSKNGGSYASITTGIVNATTSYKYTITAAQGDTYKFRVCAVNDIGSSNYSESGTVTINSLTPPTIGDLGVFNPYVNSTYTVPLSGGSQANGDGFTRRANIHVDEGFKYAGTAPSANNNTSVGITVTPANIAADLGTNAYSSTTKFSIVAWTENSNGTRSSYVSKTFTVDLNSDGGAVPTLNTPTLSGGYEDYPSTCFIVGRHNVTVTSGSASTNRAPSGTTLSYKISCTGANDVDLDTATFSGLTAGKKTITVTVTDSRGLSASKTVYCRYQTWAKPTVTITKAERNETTTTTINVEYSISYTPIYAYSANADTAGTQLNAIINQHYTTSTTYTACTSPLNITGTNNELSYNIKVRVGDKFTATEDDYGYATKTVGSVKVYISTRSHGVGLNCVPEAGQRLQVNGNAKFGTNDGHVAIDDGTLRATTSIVSSGSIVSSAGIVELVGDTPYIDFHYDNDTTADYTSRLIANGKNKLTCTSDFHVNGALDVAEGTVLNKSLTVKGLTTTSDLTPRVIYLPNADTNTTPTYPYVGLYQWGEEFQINARNEDKSWVKDMVKINVGTGVVTTSGKIVVGNGFVDSLSDIFQMSLKNGKYVKIAADSEGNVGFATDNGWIRTPVSGLIPNAKGGSGSLGTSEWSWSNIYVSGRDGIKTPNGSYYSLFSPSGSNRMTNIMFQTNSSGTRYIHTECSWSSSYGITIWASDKKLKDNIKDTEVRYALDKISQIKHVEFDWKDEIGHVDLGYVADDMEEILPSLVYEVDQHDEDGNIVGSTRQINHTTLIPLVTMGMQELIEEKDLLWHFDNLMVDEFIELKDKVNNLEKQIEELKALM